jgi:ornithine decarboxylase
LEDDAKDGVSYTIKGCTPDSMDIFRYKVLLKEKRIGDKITFLNAGAYTYSTDFCNLPKLKTVIVD